MNDHQYSDENDLELGISSKNQSSYYSNQDTVNEDE